VSRSFRFQNNITVCICQRIFGQLRKIRRVQLKLTEIISVNFKYTLRIFRHNLIDPIRIKANTCKNSRCLTPIPARTLSKRSPRGYPHQNILIGGSPFQNRWSTRVTLTRIRSLIIRTKHRIRIQASTYTGLKFVCQKTT